jgi:hypothetical protein
VVVLLDELAEQGRGLAVAADDVVDQGLLDALRRAQKHHVQPHAQGSARVRVGNHPT